MKAKEHWINAQGYDGWYLLDREIEGYPLEVCLLCGSKWRPDKPHHVAVCGKVHIPNGEWIWESFLGIYPVDGPYKDPIYRYVCHDHGDRYPVLFDCFANEEVKLSSPPTRNVSNLLDIKYWTLTILRFIWSYGGERLLYITHPIKYIRMRRWMKTEQYRKLMGEK